MSILNSSLLINSRLFALHFVLVFPVQVTREWLELKFVLGKFWSTKIILKTDVSINSFLGSYAAINYMQNNELTWKLFKFTIDCFGDWCKPFFPRFFDLGYRGVYTQKSVSLKAKCLIISVVLIVEAFVWVFIIYHIFVSCRLIYSLIHSLLCFQFDLNPWDQKDDSSNWWQSDKSAFVVGFFGFIPWKLVLNKYT